MIPCPTCKGTGTVAHHTPGFEGAPERDDEVVCSECLGLGYPDAADMLACIIAIRQSDALARSLGQPGLGSMLRARIAETMAKVCDYSTERYAEMRARGVAR